MDRKENVRPPSGRVAFPKEEKTVLPERVTTAKPSEKVREEMQEIELLEEEEETDTEDENTFPTVESRIPPDYTFSPWLEELPADHPFTMSWQKFDRDFYQLISPFSRDVVAGCPSALPPHDSDNGPIPIFVVYIKSGDIRRGFVENVRDKVRALIDLYGPEVYIRYYEWAYGALALTDIEKPKPATEYPEFNHSSKCYMGNSIGTNEFPNVGTIFAFVRVSDKETGQRRPGLYAIIPSHIASSMEHLSIMKEGDPQLRRMHSPDPEDGATSIKAARGRAWDNYQKLGREKSKKTPSDKKITRYTNCLRNAEAAVRIFCEFDTYFGEVVYASGLRSQGVEGAWPDRRRIDCALVRLSDSRQATNGISLVENAIGPFSQIEGVSEEGVIKNETTEWIRSFHPAVDFGSERVQDATIKVVKYGRSTRMTYGTVQTTRQSLKDERGETLYNWCIWSKLDLGKKDPPLSSLGDSGAPIIKEDGEILGMLFAGNQERQSQGYRVANKKGNIVTIFEYRDFSHFMSWSEIVRDIEENHECIVEWMDEEDVQADIKGKGKLSLAMPKLSPTSPQNSGTSSPTGRSSTKSPSRSRPNTPNRGRYDTTTEAASNRKQAIEKEKTSKGL